MPWVMLIVSVWLSLSTCEGQNDSSEIDTFSRGVAEAMPEADLSSAEKVETVLDSLATELDFIEIDNPGQGFAEGLTLFEVQELAMGFVFMLAEDDNLVEADTEEVLAQSPFETCRAFQEGLKRRNLSCPLVECTETGHSFQILVQGDCEGITDSTPYGFGGSVSFKGTWDSENGFFNGEETYTHFELRAGGSQSLEIPSLLAEQSEVPAKTVTYVTRAQIDGSIRYEGEGVEDGNQSTVEIEGDLGLILGVSYEIDGKQGSGEVHFRTAGSARTATRGNRSEFRTTNAVECDTSDTTGFSDRRRSFLRYSGTLDRGESDETLSVSGAFGSENTGHCFRFVGLGLQHALQESTGWSPIRFPIQPALSGQRKRFRRIHDKFLGEEEWPGKAAFAIRDNLTAPQLCPHEPTSGRLNLSTSADSADIQFNGGEKCDGRSPVVIRGKDSGEVSTRLFVTVEPDTTLTEKDLPSSSCMLRKATLPAESCPTQATYHTKVYGSGRGVGNFPAELSSATKAVQDFDMKTCVDPTTQEALESCPLPAGERIILVPLLFGGSCSCSTDGSSLACRACSGIGLQTHLQSGCSPSDGTKCMTATLTCYDDQDSTYPGRCRLVRMDGEKLFDFPRCTAGSTEWDVCSGPDSSGQIQCECLHF